MTKDEFNKIISLSIIDIVGEIEGGLGILFNFLVNQKDSYEVLFWYNEDGHILMEAEDKLLERLNVESIYDYDKFETMAFVFYQHIPNPDDLLKEYVKNNDKNINMEKQTNDIFKNDPNIRKL